MRQHLTPNLVVSILVVLLIIVIGSIVYWYRPFLSPSSNTTSKLSSLKTFSSEQEFKDYLANSTSEYSGLSGTRSISGFAPTANMATDSKAEFENVTNSSAASADRVSETNVQVAGIDEPDIVKTDGKEIYFSSPAYSDYYRGPAIFEDTSVSNSSMMPRRTGEIKTIKAYPPDDLKKDGAIEQGGNLLLYQNTLVVFSQNKIYGYDVANPASPEEKWTMSLESKNRIVGSRLYNDKIYLISQTTVDSSQPCPVQPLTVGESPLIIPCREIYHPETRVPVDSTFTILSLNPKSGEVENKVSFIGSSSYSIIYMSKNSIYVTYYYPGNYFDFTYGFYQQNTDLLSKEILQKLEKLKDYEISNGAKLLELQTLLQQYQNSLSNDDKLKIQNETTDRMKDYQKEHKRDLEKTGIVKVAVEGLKMQGTGEIPGKILNQFSLDEYENHLRIATTVGESWWGGSNESANDLYVLDKDLKVSGSVKDLGTTERIYSARFVEDKGYLVTFRQTDPFYVLDLANPRQPKLEGELKIPGYSSYLHPINKDKILGIGKEGSTVKISLFDVSSPSDPIEVDKYSLDEYWSEILNTQYAFLQDSKHQVFFLPGDKGSYIFSYQGDQLKLTKVVSDITPRRAVYLNDYLYIISDTKIVVLNEKDWKKVNQLDL